MTTVLVHILEIYEYFAAQFLLRRSARMMPPRFVCVLAQSSTLVDYKVQTRPRLGQSTHFKAYQNNSYRGANLTSAIRNTVS